MSKEVNSTETSELPGGQSRRSRLRIPDGSEEPSGFFDSLKFSSARLKKAGFFMGRKYVMMVL